MSAVFLVKLVAALFLVTAMGLVFFLLWLFHHANKGTDREDLGSVSPGWLWQERRRG